MIYLLGQALEDARHFGWEFDENGRNYLIFSMHCFQITYDMHSYRCSFKAKLVVFYDSQYLFLVVQHKWDKLRDGVQVSKVYLNLTHLIIL